MFLYLVLQIITLLFYTDIWFFIIPRCLHSRCNFTGQVDNFTSQIIFVAQEAESYKDLPPFLFANLLAYYFVFYSEMRLHIIMETYLHG
jgi:hypothetical protein